MSLYYEGFLKHSTRKQVAALIDPEKADEAYLFEIVQMAKEAQLDWFFVGGSTVAFEDLDRVVRFLKKNSSIPVILFPGSAEQLHPMADAILFTSLLSGRNPTYLIDEQKKAAQAVYDNNLRVIPTAYLLIESGSQSTTAKVSDTAPIKQLEDARHTALAGQYMGMQAVYLEAGSGSLETIKLDWIADIKKHLSTKLIVGGGIKDGATAKAIIDAGADIVVIGNALENNPKLLSEICAAVKMKE
jgi:phosphoglycerol geranylgeranyltransferase